MNTNSFCLVAVHGGAGNHSHSKAYTTEVKAALKLACNVSLAALSAGDPALDATERAIIVLEDNPILNAGYGSNLTLEGTVECDASVMDGKTGHFGSVGAISGVKNPICAAKLVLRHASIPDPLGRILPLSLVSRGAEIFAKAQGLSCLEPEALIAPRAREDWSRWKSQLETVRVGDVVPEEQFPKSQGLRDHQDTVGAIVLDLNGDLAAGVSSGGLLLKHSGRLGEAAMFGAGCWAEHYSPGIPAFSISAAACSVTGAGEYIMRSILAKTICERLLAGVEDVHEVLEQVLNKFHTQCQALGEADAQVGVLLLVKEADDTGSVIPRLWCAFTTESMALAYATSSNPEPKATILRRPTRTTSSAKIYITTLPL
ncbi:hypothetical protein QCA50_009547 [Cerrena zonata]|uniref:N-terminal nucleophile aminohydrolase n=1 Tax=Cerrena zonata TaxID=2478898 RepID=A0AAW0G6G1_9APHY